MNPGLFDQAGARFQESPDMHSNDGPLFDDYSNHPRQLIWIPCLSDNFSVAGACQTSGE